MLEPSRTTAQGRRTGRNERGRGQGDDKRRTRARYGPAWWRISHVRTRFRLARPRVDWTRIVARYHNGAIHHAGLTMKPRIALCFGLALSHVLLGLLAVRMPVEILAPIVGKSIYMPLWAFHTLGLPVFDFRDRFIPDPTITGWTVIVIVWVGVYWCIATALTWRRRR
jgi:hypothetical protein